MLPPPPPSLLLLLLLGASHSACAMVFPKADPTGGVANAPQSRGAAMTSLLSALIEAPDDSPALLRAAAPMLLAPFHGEPEPGSVYGDATSTVDERVEKYEAVMTERIERAGPAQATALRAMLLFVLDELGYEQTSDDDAEDEGGVDELMRLRGGGTSSRGEGGDGISALLRDPAVRDGVDSALRQAERGAAQLRRSLKPVLGGPTTTDAIFAGAAVGYGTGKILIGDPKLLAVVCAASFAYAHNYPERTVPQLRTAARRCSELAREAREYVTKGA